MKVKNNYDECITNLACSIRKYFELDYKHKTLEYIDDLLEKKKPKNVVVILFDGMGSRIIDRVLDKENFFIKNKVKEITSVFPATTTAATTSILTGLNPVEHGMIGWYAYIEPLDSIIQMFTGIDKETQQINERYEEIKSKYINVKSIVDEINEKGKDRGRILFPFGEDKYTDFDDMLLTIKDECKKDGKKYIYAYDEQPDSTMHYYGPDSDVVKKLIEERSNGVEKLCEDLEDTIVIIIADHGHIKVDNIELAEYPDLVKMLDKTTSIEQRAVSFRIKDEYMEEFKDKFNEYFGEYFKLYTSQEVIESKLFGNGEENKLFRSALGDYIAIAEDSNKNLVIGTDHRFVSHHAGYTDDEVYIPLIVVDRT